MEKRDELGRFVKGNKKPKNAYCFQKGHHIGKGRVGRNKGILMKEEIKRKISETCMGRIRFSTIIHCGRCNKELVVYTTQQTLCKDCKKIHRREWKKDYLKNTFHLEKHKVRIKCRKLSLKNTCEICGSNDKLERHHPDYNKPFVFMTLCQKCHIKEHKET